MKTVRAIKTSETEELIIELYKLQNFSEPDENARRGHLASYFVELFTKYSFADWNDEFVRILVFELFK